jgi:predicted metal-dependent TIM-barrel fold hydrolase
MEIFMKEIGLMIKLMVLEHINMQMVQLMLEIGLKISNMVKELKLGQMELATMETIKMEKKMEMVF